MAYQCSLCPTMQPGPKQNTYIRFGDEQRYAMLRLRLCAAHVSYIHDSFSQYEVFPDELAGGEAWLNALCVSCGEPCIESWWKTFVTAYVAKDHRKDYRLAIHHKCILAPFLKD